MKPDLQSCRNRALLLRFDGAAYHGWQSQNNAVTVQDTVEHALSRLTGTDCRGKLHGCSRTDAGVHAYSYVAHIHMGCAVPDDRLPAALHPFLPPDIVLIAACTVPDAFHARYTCTGKEYRYTLYNGREDPFLHRRACHVRYPLEADRMRAAAAHLCGTRDFAAFMATGSPVKSTIRTVQDVRIEESTSGTVDLYVRADGFLYNMMRIIAGTLLYVSAGKLAPDALPGILASGDRAQAGVTLPPWGLYLNRIWYPAGEAAALFEQREVRGDG